MFTAFARKTRQVLSDPVLRRWLLLRATRRMPTPAGFVCHKPPYILKHLSLGAEIPRPPRRFAELSAKAPTAPLTLELPGQRVTVSPGAPKRLFEHEFSDTETLLAIHRFAWLPLQGVEADPAWVSALWRAWRERFARPDNGWSWHPYTATERAINLLDYSTRVGIPAPADETVDLLAAHAPVIADRLEYFGDRYTSNHLANNGRGLYRIGLALGLEGAADLGRDILLAEAERIFRPSGILREGSSHYHLLLARNYADVWLVAQAHGRPEASAFEAIARRVIAVVPTLVLPGGLPLIGDISPDCPPDHLVGIECGEGGWAELLAPHDRMSLVALASSTPQPSPDALIADGWLRLQVDPWSALWHAAPDGWSAMPGHGHQDCGSFELHFGNEPVVVDPGRGAYGDLGEAALYRSARAHNGLMIDGADPYPPNRPYYDDAFRRSIAGAPPQFTRENDRIELRHEGYRRLSGVKQAARAWLFSPKTVTVEDQVLGKGARMVTRILHSDLPATIESGTVVLKGRRRRYRIAIDDGEVALRPATRWVAYGVGRSATAIEATVRATLPWRARLKIEAL